MCYVWQFMKFFFWKSTFLELYHQNSSTDFAVLLTWSVFKLHLLVYVCQILSISVKAFKVIVVQKNWYICLLKSLKITTTKKDPTSPPGWKFWAISSPYKRFELNATAILCNCQRTFLISLQDVLCLLFEEKRRLS